MSGKYALLPLFDTVDNISKTPDPHFDFPFWKSNYRNGLAFLISYNGSQATFNAYRRELERLLHWSWKITKKSVCDLRRADIEAYLQFNYRARRAFRAFLSKQKERHGRRA